MEYRGLSTLVRANVLRVSDLNELSFKTEATAGLVFATIVVGGTISLLGWICNIMHKPTTIFLLFQVGPA